MTSSEIRQSFLDFFHSKAHTVVPSSSLLPDAPNLLFTNAGMNQFVPFFLGERQPDVSRWAGVRSGSDRRAVDTQKCIRAGGKHNDLEDVGLDTYHQTFFEMLGNWSFGDYFKREAIDWAWELLVERWGFPPARLYATIYQPEPGDPSERDVEAWEIWAEKFGAAGLDPAVHIVNGNKADNFWMMGETGPCGPCSEVHVDLTPSGDTRGALVNKGTAECIEVWNLVFIQYNANADGTFSPLPECHVDTGMGFERVCSILQGTRGFRDFAHARISNYETDIFASLFEAISAMSGRGYTSTLPQAGGGTMAQQERVDVAFRVIADHIRTLTFAVADGITPGNTDRQYVLRRILRRAVRYGRDLGLHEPFLHRLVDVVVGTMGEVFPELRARQGAVREVIEREEQAFNRTLDDGLRIFDNILEIKKQVPTRLRELHGQFELLAKARAHESRDLQEAAIAGLADAAQLYLEELGRLDRQLLERITREDLRALTAAAQELVGLRAAARTGAPDAPDLEVLFEAAERFEQAFHRTAKVAERWRDRINGEAAFLLYDTYGFPLDLTELLAREKGYTVDLAGFDALMEQQRAKARAAQKRTVIELAQVGPMEATHFCGFDADTTEAEVVEVLEREGAAVVVLGSTVCYAEMGGQVGDTGELESGGRMWAVVDTKKSGETWLHFLDGRDAPAPGERVTVRLHGARRRAIERHHTATHLLHWALHEVVGQDVRQKGSHVGPEKLTFDFNAAALTPGQVADVERLVNERILENAGVSWVETPYDLVRARGDIMQFFGDKYGDIVRVVQIGGERGGLNGYSMELCGGTHLRATGEAGLFRILSEGAIAAGIRRVEAVAGLAGYERMMEDHRRLAEVAKVLHCPLNELEHKLEQTIAHQKQLEKELKAMRQREAAQSAKRLVAGAETLGRFPALVADVGETDGESFQVLLETLKGEFDGVTLLIGREGDAVLLGAVAGAEVAKARPAGKLIQAVAPLVDGKGGGRPEQARGAGKNPAGIAAALEQARAWIAAE